MEYLIVGYLWWSFIAGVAISAGYHRYFSHRSFKAPVWYEHLVLLLGPLAGTGSMLGWVGVHRLHHGASDTENDPHSPKYKGFWRVYFSQFPVPLIPRRVIRDLLRNKRVLWYHRHHKQIRVVSGLIFFILFPWEWAVTLFVAPFFMGHIGFGFVNAWTHKTGKPRNVWWVSLFTGGGEGYHLNHHNHVNSWRLTDGKWWQIDVGEYFIRMFGHVEK